MAQQHDWIWRAHRGRRIHLADPVDPVLTLCGIEADRIADPEHLKFLPALRCRRCARIDNDRNPQ